MYDFGFLCACSSKMKMINNDSVKAPRFLHDRTQHMSIFIPWRIIVGSLDPPGEMQKNISLPVSQRLQNINSVNI